MTGREASFCVCEHGMRRSSAALPQCRSFFRNHDAILLFPQDDCCVRIATSSFFFSSANTKSPGRALPTAVFRLISRTTSRTARSVSTARFCRRLVLPHAVFFGYAVGVIEMLIGHFACCSDCGCVRLASVLGILFLINMTSGHLVGARPRRAGLALFRSGAGSSAAVAALVIFYRG